MYKTWFAVTGFEDGKKGQELASIKVKEMDSPIDS